MRYWSICKQSGRTTGRLGCIGSTPALPRRRRDGTEGTLRLNHHGNYHQTASLSVLTTGRGEQLEDGPRRRRRWSRKTRSGLLRAGWSSGRGPERSSVKRTELPRDLPGAGRRVSPMHGTRVPTNLCAVAGALAGCLLLMKARICFMQVHR